MSRAVCLFAATFLVATVSDLKADHLVTVRGDVIETQGPWQVKGKTVVFTTPGGVLSSMRLEQIDLEASREATRRALEPPAENEPRPEPRVEEAVEAVLVITDHSLRESRGAGQGEAQVAGEVGVALDAALERAGLELTGDVERALSAAMEQLATAGEGETQAAVAQALEEAGVALDVDMGEVMQEMARALTQGLTSAAQGEVPEGLTEMGEEMSAEMAEAMVEELAQGMEAMGQFLAQATAIAVKAQALETKFDLDTPQGMRAASGEIAALAREARSGSRSAPPAVRQMLDELATQLDELATLAREDPGAAVEMYRQSSF